MNSQSLRRVLPRACDRALRPLLLVLACALQLAAVAPADPIRLEGLVADDSGAAVEGAAVTAYAARSFHQQGMDLLERVERKAAASTTTDAAGRYTLAVEPGAYEIVAEADGMTPRSYDLSPTAESSWLPEAVLLRADDVRLRVVDGEGKPAVGALVAAQPQVPRDQGPRAQSAGDWHFAWQRTTTGDEGRVELTAAAGAPLGLRVLATDGASVYRNNVQERDVELTLDAGVEWLMHVHDARGRPLQGVVAHLSQARLPAGRTDEEGRIRLRVSESPAVTLHFSSDAGHYLRTGFADDPSREQKEHTFELDDPTPVGGRVVDAESGEGVAGALVWAYGLESDPTTTDRSGGFTVTPLPGGRRLHAAAPGYGPATLHFEADAADDVTIRLHPSATLHGRVLGTDGRGIPDARLQATARQDSETNRHNAWGSGGEAASGADGEFSIRGLVAGVTYVVEASRPGYAASTSNHEVAAPPEAAEAVITLEQGFLAVGRVVDEADQPLAGATVKFLAPPESTFEGLIRQRRQGPMASGTTDADGRFALRDVGLGSYRLEVSRSGFAPAFVPGVELTRELMVEAADAREPGAPEAEGASLPEIDLGVVVLVPGVELAGRVVDSDDRPLADVTVIALPSAGAYFFAGVRRPDSRLRAVTGADGRFRFVDLRPDEPVGVIADREGYTRFQISGVVPPTEEDLKVVLERAAIVRGRVVDDAGRPVERVMVMATDAAQSTTLGMGNALDRAHTGRDGKFALERLPAGNVRLQAVAAGRTPVRSAALELEPGTVVDDLELRVSRGLEVTGIVRLSDGSPLEGVRITAETGNETDPVKWFASSTRSDAQGRFSLKGLEEGSVTVVARHQEMGEERTTAEVSAVGTHVEIEFAAGAEVSGQVVTPDGSPAQGATVKLSAPGLTADFRGGRKVDADADGRFRLDHVPDGSWQVKAEHADYAAARSETIEVSGAPVADVVLQLAPGIILGGRLLGLDFDDLGSAQVFAVSLSGPRVGQVRHDGTYRITGLSPGKVAVQAQAGDSQRSGQIEIEEGQTEATLDLDFASGHELVGSLKLDGEPLDGVQVFLVGAGGQSGMGTSNFRGEFRVAGLEAGTYHLQIRDARRGFSHEQSIDIPHPAPLDLDVRTAEVTGRVIAADGAPLPGTRIEARRQPAPGEDPNHVSQLGLAALFGTPSTTSAEDGSYRVGRLAEGTWRLVASQDGYAQEEIVLQVVQGSDLAGIDFTLQPTLGLHLDLRPAAGVAMPSVVDVAIFDPSGRQLAASRELPDGSGAVHLRSLPAGVWQVAVAADGLATVDLRVEAPADRPQVVLERQSTLELRSPSTGPALGDDVVAFARVTREDGTIHRRIARGQVFDVWPMRLGQRLITGLSAGTWHVEVERSDGTALRATARIAVGEKAVVELR